MNPARPSSPVPHLSERSHPSNVIFDRLPKGYMLNSQTNQNTTTGTPAATVLQQDTRSGLEIARGQFSGSTFRLPGTETPKATVPTDAEVMATLSNEALTLRAMLMLGGMSAADANARAIASDRSQMTGKELARTQWAGANETEKAVNAANQARWDEALRARNEKARAIEQARQENNFHGLNLAPVHYTPIKSPAAITAPAAAAPTPATPAATATPEPAPVSRGEGFNASMRGLLVDMAEDWRGTARTRPDLEKAAMTFLAREGHDIPLAARQEAARLAAQDLVEQCAAGSPPSKVPAAASLASADAVKAHAPTMDDRNASLAASMLDEPSGWAGSLQTRTGLKIGALIHLARQASSVPKADREQIAETVGTLLAQRYASGIANPPPAPASPAKPAKSTAAAPTGTPAAPASTGILGWLERRMRLNRFTSGTR